MYRGKVNLRRQEPPRFARLAAHPLRWALLTQLAKEDLRVRELVAATGEAQNVVSYHLRLLRDAGLVIARRSSADGRDSYHHLDLDACSHALVSAGTALHPALGMQPAPPPVASPGRRVSVRFVCTGNSARSPIAEALLQSRAAGTVRASSAGTAPKTRLHPDVARVLLDEYDVDIGDRYPQRLSDLAGPVDYLVTLCDKAREVPDGWPDTGRRLHWSVPDPATAGSGTRTERRAVSAAAAEINARVRHLLPVLLQDDRKANA